MQFELTVPTSINQLTLEQYQEYLQIEEPDHYDVFSTFLGVSKDAIRKLKLTEVKKVTAHLMGLFEGDKPLQRTFKMDGVTYGFIPKLDDISLGENDDIQNYIQDWKTMHRAMAVMFRPIISKKGDKYLIEEYEGSDKYADKMRNMPLGIALGAMVFFYNLLNDLLNYIPNFIQDRVKSQSHSLENGEAILEYTHLLRETLPALTKLHGNHYINVS